MRAREVRPRVQVLERGGILFLYRPKSGVAHVQSADDLERLYFMLIPDDWEEHKSRIYGLSGRRLPALTAGRAAPEERAWALAEEAHPDPRVALDNLQEKAAASRPPGQRTRPWVRAAGEGRYAVLRHAADTHLAYALDKPERPGEAQEALQMGEQGNYSISVRAPAAPSGIEVDRRPLYPPRLQSRFGRYERIPVEPSDYLDYRDTQVLLFAVDSDVEQELGLKLEPEVQNQGQKQALQILHKEERRAAQEGVALLEPLKEGHWA